MMLKLIILSLFILIFVVISHYAIKKIAVTLQTKYDKKKRFFLSSLLTALIIPLQTFIWLYAIFYLSDMFSNSLNWEINCWSGKFLTKILLIFCISWFFYLWKKNAIRTYKKEKKRNDPNLHYIDALDRLSSILIIFLFIMFVLDQIGQNIGTLLTIGGIGAASIGFAAKDLISNFFGGFLIYINSPFYLGDTIQVSGKEIKGDVEEIGWCSTKIRDEEKQSLFVPNALFFQFIIINFSRKTHKRFKEHLFIQIKDDSQISPILSAIKGYLLNFKEIDLSEKYEIICSFINDNVLKLTLSFYSKEINNLEFESLRQNFLIEVRKIVHDFGLTLTNEQLPLKIQNIE